MNDQYTKRRGRRKKGVSFNPNHEDLSSAVKDFLNKGGKIEKVDPMSAEYEEVINRYHSNTALDSIFQE